MPRGFVNRYHGANAAEPDDVIFYRPLPRSWAKIHTMSFTRRQFIASLSSSLAAASLPALSTAAASAPDATRSLRILILGGTGFLGPFCTESALARGHKLTHFNSGRTEERRRGAGRPSLVPAGVEQLYGNRDPNKTADDRRSEGSANAQKDPNSPKGLTQLQGRKWDAVIDTSGYFPRMVKASAELLASNVKQYVFISSISVYKDNSVPGYDETAELHTLKDPTTEEMGKNYENFGGGKALCEKAAETAMPGRVTNIRPGYIVGPRDTSARFIYWPVRVSLGGTIAVPGRPNDPIQIIDVRDLADWIIHCIEGNVVGVYNATGPARPLSMQAMLEAIQEGIGSKSSFTWIENSFLHARGILEGQFPLHAPPTGETAGFHRCSIARALAKGLKFRPVSDTAKATLDWYKSLPDNVKAGVAPQFAATAGQEPWLDVEKKLLKDWEGREKA
jgi:2'-hydroxyisoflavone reductase